MTDDELDQARAKEAHRLFNAEFPAAAKAHQLDRTIWSRAAHYAARLAREGWTPPDPLQAEIEKILSSAGQVWADSTDGFGLMRKAMLRGIEIGRAQS